MWRRVVCYKVPPYSGSNVTFSAAKRGPALCTGSSVNIPENTVLRSRSWAVKFQISYEFHMFVYLCRLELWNELFSISAGWGNTWRKTRKATLWYTRQIRRIILGLRKGSASSCNHHSSPPCCFRRLATQLPPWHQLPSQIEVSRD